MYFRELLQNLYCRQGLLKVSFGNQGLQIKSSRFQDQIGTISNVEISPIQNLITKRILIKGQF